MSKKEAEKRKAGGSLPLSSPLEDEERMKGWFRETWTAQEKQKSEPGHLPQPTIRETALPTVGKTKILVSKGNMSAQAQH